MAAGIISRLVNRLFKCTIIIASVFIFCRAGSAYGDEFSATGFVLRNNSPFTAIIGIPSRWPDGSNHSSELSWTVSSHASFEDADAEALLVDGETQTLSLRWQKKFLNRFQFGIDAPWIHHSGGFMDEIIDTWHDITGLNEGIRPQTPKNNLQYVYQADGTERYRLDDSTSGIGDVRLGLTTRLGELFGAIPWHLTLGADLPVGDAEDLTGNGNPDYSAGLGFRSRQPAGDRLAWWLDLGLVWPGDVDLPDLAPSGQIFYYDAALAWRAARRVDLLVQFVGNTAPYQSGVKTLGDPALQIAVGLVWHLGQDYGIRIGFTEDLRTETAPDFGFEISLILKRFP